MIACVPAMLSSSSGIWGAQTKLIPIPTYIHTCTQYVAALRKLIHLPLVVLCADSEKFASLLHGVRQRLRQSSRPLARHVGTPPGTRDIYFVQGSPKKRTDLDRCCVEAAYGVVLLGDDVPRKRGADDGEADPVLQVMRATWMCCLVWSSIDV